MLNVCHQVFLRTLFFQVDETAKETQRETIETEEPPITAETSPRSEPYTSVVASGSDYNHGDSLYMSEASENASTTERAVSFPQSTCSANVSVTTVKLYTSNSRGHFSFVS